MAADAARLRSERSGVTELSAVPVINGHTEQAGRTLANVEHPMAPIDELRLRELEHYLASLTPSVSAEDRRRSVYSPRPSRNASRVQEASCPGI